MTDTKKKWTTRPAIQRQTLSDAEVKRLISLGKRIKESLSCNINWDGLPCGFDRVEAVRLMKRYIRLQAGSSTLITLKPISEYLGLDGLKYGPYKENEKIHIPEEEAEWLIKAGLAEAI
jgi:hypothetical protein